MKNSILLWIFIFLAATTVAAQDAISPILGKNYSYLVEQHAGSTYEWEILSSTSPYNPASSLDYAIVGSSTQNQVTIQWLAVGTYLLVLTETDFSGCSNKKALALQVTAANQYVQFTASSQTLCYVEAVSGILMPVSFTDQSGSALGSAKYPITISYTIDGVAQTSQSITEADQNLHIDATQLSGNGSVDQSYSVVITGAVDVQDQTIQAQTGHDTYSLTLIAQPVISFSQTAVQLSLNTVRGFTVNGSSNFIYQWKVALPDGSTQALSSASETSDEISFGQVGSYLLQVRAKGSNNCWGEWQSLTVTVKDDNPPPPPPVERPLLAIADINLGWKNETISGNVFTNDFHGEGTTTLAVTVVPDANTGKLLSFNKKTGDYVFKPFAGYVGDTQFEYELCETDLDGNKLCSSAKVTLQILENELTQTRPAAIDKIYAAGENGTITGNFLDGDIELIKQALLSGQPNSSSLTGTFSSSTNGSFSYKAAPGSTGAESFSYKLCDGNVCDWASVTLYFWDSGYDEQVLLAGDRGYYNTGVLKAQLPGNRRTDGASDYSYSVVTDPGKGTLDLNQDGTFTYTPNAGQLGYFTDQFVYQLGNLSCSSKATVYISSYIEAPTLIVQNQFASGDCSSVKLDASKSTGIGNLSYSWSPSNYLDDADIAVPTFIAGASTDYTLTLTDALGNQDQRTVHVAVAPQPDVVTDPYIFVQDPSASVMLDASASVGSNLSYSWSSAGSGVIVSGQNAAQVEVKGTGKYYLSITDQYGCMETDSVIVGVWVQAVDDQATALVNTYVSINVLRNDIPQGDLDPSTVSIVVPPTNGIVDVQPDSVIVYTPNQDFIGQDNFVYRVCNYFNKCDDATVLVIVNEESLFIPNAFTPNGDGYNDYFEIKGLSKYSHVNLKVFNRWGNLVYESANYGNGGGQTGYWNGVANRGVRLGKGEVPAGTYFYTLDLGKGTEKLSGFIYIDR